MRRSRSSLTAWPAFADLMTIIAVVSLAIAIGVLAGGPNGPCESEECQAEISKLQAKIGELEKENERLGGENLAFTNQLDDARKQIRELELSAHFGFNPCLSNPKSPTTAVPLLRIVANSGYVLTQIWDVRYDAAVEEIPSLHRAINHGQMDRQRFESYAREIYQYGDAQNTFDGSCRFFVELKNETGSLASFAQARAVVETYFGFSNPSEVIAIQKGSDGSADRDPPL